MVEAHAQRPVSAAPTIRVEVVHCAERSSIDSTSVDLPPSATVADALQASGILSRFPALQRDVAKGINVGIWGRSTALHQVVHDGDRIELYRRLVIDPKDARRLRQRLQARDTARRRGPQSR